jgi:voltage-gated potassium channel
MSGQSFCTVTESIVVYGYSNLRQVLLMGFTIEFVKIFAIGVFYASPLIIFLISLISVLGLVIGKREGWSLPDSVYYAFITATTVGYGDYRPANKTGKFLAIGIAFVGLLLTGIVVAIGLEAATMAFRHIHSLPVI